jgi:hypothetical protein
MRKLKNDDQLVQNMRFYGELRLKQFTLFLTWLTIVGVAIVQGGERIIILETSLKLMLAFASMLVCGILWIMEISSTLYWKVHREKCVEKWPKPKIKMAFINATNAVLILYIWNYAFGLVCSYSWGGKYYLSILFGLFGILLLVFSMINYEIFPFKARAKNTAMF